jgi:hypothetical protein
MLEDIQAAFCESQAPTAAEKHPIELRQLYTGKNPKLR